MKKGNSLDRRDFLDTAATSLAFSIVPRRVLGGAGFVAPSDKVTMALVGCGTQGLTEQVRLLPLPELQMVAACDPNKDSTDYVEWSKDSVRRTIANGIGKPDWRAGRPGVPGGREAAKEIVELYYGSQKSSGSYKGCSSYADFRELLEKEKDLNLVKIMTPDHLHAAIAIAAMKKGKQVVVHKPLANRLQEARRVIETARQTKAATHFLPASPGTEVRLIAGWIREGVIGNLREIHNWSSRPFWPQYPVLPADTPPVPQGLDWDLWLGPSLPRPYHPWFTHAVFRGWYEFGGGSLADMGHYSLWPVFQEFSLDAPVSVESAPTHHCAIVDQVSRAIQNDYSYPAACTIRFKFAAKGNRPAMDIFWYDGGIRPPVPEELEEDQGELPVEGMMWVGDKGRILGGFRGENSRIIPERKWRSYWSAKGQEPPAAPERRAGSQPITSPDWLKAFQAGESTYGSFLRAGPISEAFNLASISLRLGGRKLIWDSAQGKITNRPEANRYLGREYRPGWELEPS